MATPKGFKPADLGGEPTEVLCRPLFRTATISWSDPKPWKRDEDAPIADAEQKPGYLYAISWDHHRATHKETIAYIGITKNLSKRFANHPKAEALVRRKRSTFLSVGSIDFGRLTNASAKTKAIAEELEHLLIWALWPDLVNVQKMVGLPAWGANGGYPWVVKNDGYHFSGAMPLEIIYPWMLVKPGRRQARSAVALNA